MVRAREVRVAPGQPNNFPSPAPTSPIQPCSHFGGISHDGGLRRLSGQQGDVLYVLPSGATPVVVMELDDETGVRWSRTNDEDPQRLNLSA
jgi:hypothetical protein